MLKRILIIDDSATDVELLRLAFAREKVTQPVDVVDTGRKAIEYLAAADPLPILVLLDWKLPDIPGFELLRIFRGDPKLKDLPLVVLSGNENKGDIDRAYQVGASSYLNKPLSLADFQYTIAGLKKRWLTD